MRPAAAAPPPPPKNPFLVHTYAGTTTPTAATPVPAVDPFDTSSGDRTVELPRAMLKYLEFLYRKSVPIAQLFLQTSSLEQLVGLVYLMFPLCKRGSVICILVYKV